MDRLGKTSAASGMEISVEKTKLMTNNTNGINIDVRINGEILDEVDSFKFLPSVSMQTIQLNILRNIAQLFFNTY